MPQLLYSRIPWSLRRRYERVTLISYKYIYIYIYRYISCDWRRLHQPQTVQRGRRCQRSKQHLQTVHSTVMLMTGDCPETAEDTRQPRTHPELHTHENYATSTTTEQTNMRHAELPCSVQYARQRRGCFFSLLSNTLYCRPSLKWTGRSAYWTCDWCVCDPSVATELQGGSHLAQTILRRTWAKDSNIWRRFADAGGCQVWPYWHARIFLQCKWVLNESLYIVFF